MKRLTLFTLLYLSMGVCFTVVAFRQQSLTPIPHEVAGTWVAVCLTYFCAFFSTFPWWHQSMVRDPDRLNKNMLNRPIWQNFLLKRGSIIILVWFTILLIADLLNLLFHYQSVVANTTNICLVMPVVAIGIETFFVRNQAEKSVE